MAKAANNSKASTTKAAAAKASGGNAVSGGSAATNRKPAKNRGDVVDEVAALTDLPQAKVDQVIKAFEKSVSDALVSGGDVRLAGFGVFKVSQRAAATRRNPRTGEPVDVPARMAPRFQPGKTLKALVEEGGNSSGATKAAKSASPGRGPGKSLTAANSASAQESAAPAKAAKGKASAAKPAAKASSAKADSGKKASAKSKK